MYRDIKSKGFISTECC